MIRKLRPPAEPSPTVPFSSVQVPYRTLNFSQTIAGAYPRYSGTNTATRATFPFVLPFPGITGLLVVALAAHSQAAAWEACAASYASTDCSGKPIAGSGGCVSVNGGCEEDTAGPDAGTWDKSVSTADACVAGAVVMDSNENADEAACTLANATVVAATMGDCRAIMGIPGYGSTMTKFACTSLVSTVSDAGSDGPWMDAERIVLIVIGGCCFCSCCVMLVGWLAMKSGSASNEVDHVADGKGIYAF